MMRLQPEINIYEKVKSNSLKLDLELGVRVIVTKGGKLW